VGVYDLQLVSGDLAFGPDDEPKTVAGTDAVAQDVQHRLLESGLVPELVADDAGSAAALGRIVAEVEEDERIEPGTAEAEATGEGAYTVRATVLNGDTITQTVGT